MQLERDVPGHYSISFPRDSLFHWASHTYFFWLDCRPYWGSPLACKAPGRAQTFISREENSPEGLTQRDTKWLNTDSMRISRWDGKSWIRSKPGWLTDWMFKLPAQQVDKSQPGGEQSLTGPACGPALPYKVFTFHPDSHSAAEILQPYLLPVTSLMSTWIASFL